MKQCLYCYEILNENEIDFHASCSKKIFGTILPPELPYSETQIEELALQIVQSQIAVTGVQPKLSLDLISNTNNNQPKRFTIVGLWGEYILKPPTSHYIQLPEVEDLTMHLAAAAKIKVVPHSLIRLKSGKLAYITKRIDRSKKNKLHMEDMCQLTERLTENKYHGSYEQIAKAILKYSTNPGLDVVNFFEQIVFSFLTGNADMHLKNFSLIHQPKIGPVLSPAYDMVATSIVNPEDDEEMALTLNAKKKKIRKSDFIAAFTSLNLEKKQQENIFNKMKKSKEKWFDLIDRSFLSEDFKKSYKELILMRFERIEF
ncbi:HipA domain-containing protein [Flavobacterium pectinovorum]|uniref:HipA domain-containing protein n=1 Tax=Flavobacterium pectinovorum TaxID=29533 RepID=UPI001FAD7857|nr:HipA domain-containing protein [Flavobacterium pectinovorum]MCI9846063.1 HipA domain-containing protein [Flavobacterium pectinovorum]